MELISKDSRKAQLSSQAGAARRVLQGEKKKNLNNELGHMSASGCVPPTEGLFLDVYLGLATGNPLQMWE